MSVYVWSSTKGCMVDKKTAEPLNTGKEWTPMAPYVFSDIGEFQSPIDGSLISSRAALREHNKKHDVIQVGNDQGNIVEKMKKRQAEWAEAAKGSESGWMDPD